MGPAKKSCLLKPRWRANLWAEGSVVEAGRAVALTARDASDEIGRLVAGERYPCDSDMWRANRNQRPPSIGIFSHEEKEEESVEAF